MECPMVPCSLQTGEGAFPHHQVRATAQVGTQLIDHYGSLHMALRAVQEKMIAEHHVLVTNAQTHLGFGPELRDGIMELRSLGAIPRYRGISPGKFRARGLPHNPAGRDYITEQLWPYVQKGKMFVSTGNGIPPDNEFLRSPSTTVAKGLPDRAISTEKRAIWDGRAANLHCPKFDYWRHLTPSVHDIARRYCHLETSAPRIEIVGTKRDIDAACTRCRLRPDPAVLFGAEFPLGSDTGGDIILFYMVLPFGFT